MSKSKMLKVIEAVTRIIIALYRRVSTDRQADEGYSLEVQREKLLLYAKSMDNVVEIREYTDDGYSGGSLDRPGMQELIQDVEAGIITHVLVVKLDRLSRSQKDTLHLIEDIFIPNNVAFISIMESFNTETAFGRAMVGILSVFAQLERENIYERTRGGMQKRVEAGYWPGGGGTPFGYDYDPQQGILIPNNDAEKVKYIYDRYLAGAAMQVIADELGLKYEKTIYNIITRKTNTGIIVYNGTEYPGRHKAIISLDIYEQAMDLLAIRSANRLVTKTDHLLTGLVFCGICGAKMRYMKWGKAGHKLMCYSKMKSKSYLVRDPNCNNTTPWAEDVEDAVVTTLFAASKNRLEGAKKAIEAVDTSQIIQDQLRSARIALSRLYDLYADSGDELLHEKIQAKKTEVTRLEKSLADENIKAASKRRVMRTYEQLDTMQGAWEEMTVQERRAVLTSVIESITINGEYTDVKLKYNLS